MATAPEQNTDYAPSSTPRAGLKLAVRRPPGATATSYQFSLSGVSAHRRGRQNASEASAWIASRRAVSAMSCRSGGWATRPPFAFAPADRRDARRPESRSAKTRGGRPRHGRPPRSRRRPRRDRQGTADVATVDAKPSLLGLSRARLADALLAVGVEGNGSACGEPALALDVSARRRLLRPHDSVSRAARPARRGLCGRPPELVTERDLGRRRA